MLAFKQATQGIGETCSPSIPLQLGHTCPPMGQTPSCTPTASWRSVQPRRPLPGTLNRAGPATAAANASSRGRRASAQHFLGSSRSGRIAAPQTPLGLLNQLPTHKAHRGGGRGGSCAAGGSSPEGRRGCECIIPRTSGRVPGCGEGSGNGLPKGGKGADREGWGEVGGFRSGCRRKTSGSRGEGNRPRQGRGVCPGWDGERAQEEGAVSKW